jgi:hypothetical protein
LEKKYVITVFGAPVIFDSKILHSELKVDARSAGFVKIWVDPDTQTVKAQCYGESLSLKLESMPKEDVKIIEDFFNKDQLI